MRHPLSSPFMAAVCWNCSRQDRAPGRLRLKVLIIGHFLVPFYLLLVVIGVPVCYVQLKIGALYRRGVVATFAHIVPILKGIAVALLIMTYFRSITHALELSYGLVYMFASLRQPFPWDVQPSDNVSREEAKITIFSSSPEDRYFVQEFLQRSDRIGSISPPVWYLVLALLAVWIIVFLFTLKGSAGLGKIVCILTPVTALVVCIVLIYAYAVIPGACDALYTFFSGNLHNRHENGIVYVQMQLGDAKMWLDALDLHLYGLGLWAGILPSLGSHLTNKKVVVNAAVGVMMLFYGCLPHLLLVAIAPFIDPAYNTGWFGHAHGVKSGLSYLFISVPHTMAKHGLSPFIAFLLFLAYVLLGLHHLVLHVLVVWENVWPALPRPVMLFFRRPALLLAVFCFLSFILSAPFASGCGVYLYQVVRFYVDRLLFALVIFSMVPFIIGYLRQETFRLPIERIWMSVWYGIASLTTASLLIYNFAVYIYPERVVGYDERWAEDVGWCVAITPLLLGVALGALHALLKGQGNLLERFLGSLKMGRVPEPDNTDDYDSGETGDTAVQGGRSPRPPHTPRSLSQPLVPSSQGPLPSGIPSYGVMDKAEVEVIMNSSKSCDGDIARV
ncbi:sodium- and chloride-dependent neutral and basic amino acid transporter B(0+)-like [Littorina saxatilis]|uniref:sodium- and chloride-dependent neutral and basic amino acid transporter B(0+)-like n=1 Tax=Littorina saxatilis TaxID=31220 RepID=UPI0038B5EE94